VTLPTPSRDEAAPSPAVESHRPPPLSPALTFADPLLAAPPVLPPALAEATWEIDPYLTLIQAAMALYSSEDVAEVDRIRSEEILSGFLLTE
jgi:hypothetical protein